MAFGVRLVIYIITILLLAGNICISQTSRKNTQSEKSTNKQNIKSVAADKHVTVNRSNRQWKSNTTMGMYRGWPEKTNRHNFLSDQDQADGDDVETSQENSEAQPTKKKKRFWEKFKFLQKE